MSGPNLKDRTDLEFNYSNDTSFELLKGLKIKKAKINDAHDVVVLITADDKKFFLTWSGDCCATCFLAHVSGAEHLIDAEIISVEHKEWIRKEKSEDEYEVVESMGTIIKTSKGYVDLESRLEHNGFYSGEIQVSDIAPIGQYSNYLEEPTHLKVLKDF